jgi:C-terminal processing protease CtpA/Prc
MSKVSAVLLALLTCTVHLSTSAQQENTGDTVTEISIDKDSLDYYLLQAVSANKPQQRLKLNHIGLITISDDQGFIVSSVLDGYPAQAVGLRAGDRIDTVDDSPFHPLWSFNSQSENAEGFLPNDSMHKIEFDRNGMKQTVSIVSVFENLYDSYRSATLNSRQEFNSGNKVIGYLKLWSVSRSTNDLITFKSLIDSLSHCDGLILDLRDGYGFIEAEHLDQFFPSRTSYFDFRSEVSEVWRTEQAARQSDDYYGKAMVVIQNKGTRSGLELFSYQLATLQRVVSLGEQTAGSLGTLLVDSRNNDLRYQADVETAVDELNIETEGLAPEQQIEFTLDESLATDPQFEAAVSTLMAIM